MKRTINKKSAIILSITFILTLLMIILGCVNVFGGNNSEKADDNLVKDSYIINTKLGTTSVSYFNSNKAMFSFTPTTSAKYTVDISISSANTYFDVYVLTQNLKSYLNNGRINAARFSKQHEIEVTLTKGTTYYIYIESVSTISSSVKASVKITK